MTDWLPSVADPSKRLFAGYLLSALVIALLWLRYAQGVELRDCWARIFARDNWWSASARADYRVAILNSILMPLLAPRLLGQAAVAYAVFEGLHQLVGGRALLDAPGWAIAGGFTLCLFVADDFARYWVHRLLHRVPLLWAFHKVHHGATALNPVTVLRTHPVEMLLFSLRSALVYGACIGGFFFFFGNQVTLLTVLGAGVFNFVFNLLGSNLRHSPVPIGFWKPLEKIFMSPAQHQVHHSAAREHRDRNFGVALSLWDYCFATLCHSERGKILKYGLGDGEPAAHGLRSLYLAPFSEAAGILFKSKSDTRGTKMKTLILSWLAFLGLTLALPVYANEAQVVNIYSARKEALILPLLKRFQEQTGIEFRLVTGKADGLLKRLQIEGHASPVDVFITVDAGRLQRAKEAGLLQPIDNPLLDKRIPPNLRDRDNQWFGLSQRARVIFYVKDNVDPSELSTYEALADDKWRGRICMRSSNAIYNQSLVASMIEADGIEETEAWAKKLVANFARKPAGGDTDQLRAAAAGLCDIAVANTYYYGRLLDSDKEKDRRAAARLGLFWPNQDGRGAHVNVSGAGVAKYSKHRDAAIKLLEFLVSDEAQAWYARVNDEYPVVDGVKIPATLKSFGEFRSDTLNLTLLGENNRAAVELMDRAGWR